MGVIDLGLTVAEFWQMTPRRVINFSKRWREAERRTDRRTALQGYYMATFFGARKQGNEPFTLSDFGLGEELKSQYPTLEEFLEQERLGEERLRAYEAGLPNPQTPDPNADVKVAMAEALSRMPR